MRSTLIITAVCVSSFARLCNAEGIPTVDVPNTTQATTTAINSVKQVSNQVEQIQNQIEQFNKLQEQLNQQVAQFESITGNYNMGALLNTKAYQDARRFIPTTWQETLELLDGAIASNNQQQTQTATRTAREAEQKYAPEDIYDDVTSDEAVNYANQSAQIYTQLGVGQSNYARSTQRIENVEDLAAEIDTATDLKAAIDLQNRIQSEQALLSIELIKLVSATHINHAQERSFDHNQRAIDLRLSDATLPPLPTP